MIRTILFDLGNTLARKEELVPPIKPDALFPHVLEAMSVLQGLEVADEEPVTLGIVSDYTMPAKRTRQEIDRIVEEFMTVLETINLAPFFDPFERHVTLSTHAGVNKPDERVFKLALKRLGVPVEFPRCLFITEDAAHIAACSKNLKMETLQFGREPAPGVDFTDWSEAPLIIAGKIAGGVQNNLESALRLRLSVGHDIQLTAVHGRATRGRIHGQGLSWTPVPDPRPNQSGQVIEVPCPLELEIRLDDRGGIGAVTCGKPRASDLKEATHYLRTLAVNEQLSETTARLSRGATHELVTDERGRKRLVRRRFSAL